MSGLMYCPDCSEYIGGMETCSCGWKCPPRATDSTEYAELRDDRDRLAAENAELRACLADCADDLESEVEARRAGDLPRRIERDLAPVKRARELLAARPNPNESTPPDGGLETTDGR